MPFENINIELFQIINASANPAPWMVLVARILAQWVVYAVVLWMVIAWIRTGPRFRVVLLDGFLSATLALGIGQVIGFLWYHARPFEMKLGHQLLAHTTVTSFPSDHGLFMFALAATFLLHTIHRNWAWILLLAGLGVAWSRVYLGVHFPFDMIGAFIVASISAIVIKMISPLLQASIYPLLLRLYETIIAMLRLPQGIFPRSG